MLWTNYQTDSVSALVFVFSDRMDENKQIFDLFHTFNDHERHIRVLSLSVCCSPMFKRIPVPSPCIEWTKNEMHNVIGNIHSFAFAVLVFYWHGRKLIWKFAWIVDTMIFSHKCFYLFAEGQHNLFLWHLTDSYSINTDRIFFGEKSILTKLSFLLMLSNEFFVVLSTSLSTWTLDEFEISSIIKSNNAKIELFSKLTREMSLSADQSRFLRFFLFHNMIIFNGKRADERTNERKEKSFFLPFSFCFCLCLLFEHVSKALCAWLWKLRQIHCVRRKILSLFFKFG